MRWRPQSCRVLRQSGEKLLLLLVALAGVLSAAAAAGCGSASPSPSAAQPTPSLYFLVDANAIAATSVHDLHSSLVALDARDGHIAWRHALEASSPTDATTARFQPVYRDGVVYVGYTYDHAADPQNYVRHGAVEALEATTGTMRWRREVGTDFDGELVVDGSAVYASAEVEIPGQQGATTSGLLEALDV
jgi:outer membrane protein assembly factor BamB